MSSNKLFFLSVFLSLVMVPKVFAHCGVCEVSSYSPERQKESISSGAMLNSPTATTVGRSHVAAGFVFEYDRFNSIAPDTAHALHESGRDIHGKDYEEYYNMLLGYGLWDDLDIHLVAPIVSKTSLQIEDAGDDGAGIPGNLGRRETFSGFGDMRLLGKYRFWKKFVEAALIAGIKFPTGTTSKKDKSGNKFEPEQAPGSGSWDGEFGLALSRSFFHQLSFAQSFKYTLKGEGAQDRKSGDEFRYSLGTSYALRKFGKYPNLSIVAELNNIWMLRDHSRKEDKVFDSGGTTIFVTPGLSADITRNISAFWAISTPIYQNLGGEHEELKIRILAGVNIHF